MKLQMTIALCAVALCGCASHNKPKPIHERPWIGGRFESVPTPAGVRPDASLFGKNAPLIVALHDSSPLHKAGLQEGDLILAIDGKEMRYPREVREAVEQRDSQPSTFTIYRQGEVLEKTVMPGTERYQEIGIFTCGIGFSSHLTFDLLPNPDFSLVALGFEQEHDRLNLNDPKSLYLRHLQDAAAAASGQTNQHSSASLRSDEGWKFWLGPFSLERRKTILSQE
jgi:hypothetical protein